MTVLPKDKSDPELCYFLLHFLNNWVGYLFHCNTDTVPVP